MAVGGAVCSHYSKKRRQYCNLTNEPIPSTWGFCFIHPQNCPRVKKWAGQSIAIKDSDSEDLLDIDVLDAVKTAVELIDNAISGNEMQVDVVNTPDVNIEPLGGIAGNDQETIGTSAVQLSSAQSVPCACVIVTPLSTNTGILYVGKSGVTTSTGFELVYPLALDVDNVQDVYAIASLAAQEICWLAVL
jgi:hypothetical protein